jgi:hypothetical protein
MPHLVSCLTSQPRTVKLKQHVRQIDNDTTVGFTSIQVVPFQFLNKRTIPGNFLSLLVKYLLLCIKRLVSLFDLTSDHIAAQAPDSCTDGSPGASISLMAPDDRATTSP